MTSPPDELRSPPPLLSGRRGALLAALLVLTVAVVAIVVARPSREGVGTTAAQTSAPSSSPSASASPSPEASPEPSPSVSYAPALVPPPLVAKTGGRLMVVQRTRLQVLDVDSGRRPTIATDSRLADHDRIDALAVGREVVFLGDDQTGAGNGYQPAYTTTAGPGSRLRQIGRASNLIRSDRPGRIWLSDVENYTPSLTTLTEVDLRGRVYRHARFEGSFGVEPFADGYLRQTVLADKREGEDVELVDAAGRRRQLYPHVSVLLVGGKTALLADRVACEERCDLHVLTAGASVTERVLHLGPTPDLIEGGLTNDGSGLIVGVRQEGAEPAPSLLSRLDLRTGVWRPITDGRAAAYFGGSFRFSPDGRWMFFVDGDEKHVNAYDLSARHVYRVKGSFAQITQLELLPS